LTIKKLEFFDKGFVQCTANNGVDKITSHSHLIVNPETQTWGKFSLIIDIIFFWVIWQHCLVGSTAANALNFGNVDSER